MKILVLFCDMLKITKMNIYDPNNKKVDLDVLFEELGGTLYTNTYSSTPDTSRSLAQFWTGLTPKKNGCDLRIKYPKYYLKNVKTIYDELNELNYSTIFHCTETAEMLGVFPETIKNKIHHGNNNDFDHILNKVQENNKYDKSFEFISLDDYHYACDDIGPTLGDKLGKEKLDTIIRKIIYDKNIDHDYIIIFSDHGNKQENYQQEEEHLFINDDRSKIFMFIHKKDDVILIKNDDLHEILDFYPTLCQILGKEIPKELQGISFFESVNEERKITFEDYKGFETKIQDLPSLWGVRYKNIFYFETLNYSKIIDINTMEEINDKDEIIFEKALSENTVYYSEAKKQKKILIQYKNYKNYLNTYSNGSPRIKLGIMNRIKNKIRRWFL